MILGIEVDVVVVVGPHHIPTNLDQIVKSKPRHQGVMGCSRDTSRESKERTRACKTTRDQENQWRHERTERLSHCEDWRRERNREQESRWSL